MKLKSLMSGSILLLAVWMLTACGSSQKREVPSGLENITWELSAYGYEENLQNVLDKTFPTAFFDQKEATVSGSGGCNHYGGEYTAQADKLSIGALFSTEMYCQEPEGVMEQEETFLTLLSDAVSYRLTEGDGLQIKSTDDQVLVFEKVTEVEVDMEDNGTQIHLQKGDFLRVSLSSNATTGYQWEVVELDTSMLQQIGESEYVSPEQTDPPMVGAGGTEIFRFRAVDIGNSSLKLIYKQPWGTEFVRTYVLEVSVE